MSDRAEAFDSLLQALSGHFVIQKQTRINKQALLTLMYESIGSEFRTCSELCEAYYRQHGAGKRRQGLEGALRRALTTLSKWMQRHYEQYPEHGIQFEIVEQCRLRAVVKDDFGSLGVLAITTQVQELLERLQRLSADADALFAGRRRVEYAHEFSQRVQEIRRTAEDLQKAQNALRRRI